MYGVSMKCMKKWVLSEPIVDPIDQQDILTDTDKCYHIDLKTVTKSQLDFNSNFTLHVEIEGVVHGFVTWFDCQFTHGTKRITLSTSPYKKQTHWKQTVFYLSNPLEVKVGDCFAGTINVTKAPKNPRELNVCIDFKLNALDLIRHFYRIS